MKRALHLILLLGFLCTIVPFGWYTFRFYSARSMLLQDLGRAATVADLQTMVEQSGSFLVLRDGSWIAIHYADCHDGGPSVTVAADSGGGVLDSRKHFCGHFGFYASFRKRYVLAKDPAEVAARFTPQQISVYSRLLPEYTNPGPIMDREDIMTYDLYRVERASNLHDARQALKGMGFGSTWTGWKPPSGTP